MMVEMTVAWSVVAMAEMSVHLQAVATVAWKVVRKVVSTVG